ncbi:hypothetical protein Q5P01_008308 [Channa striata]|uniref:Uncharacterized protein n=1 Tax=Channa striata TaxID=64152 RepID=A0AA88NB25_CHASR|nr:hypothetical protein Q5P01_008308 [Channa striata]
MFGRNGNAWKSGSHRVRGFFSDHRVSPLTTSRLVGKNGVNPPQLKRSEVRRRAHGPSSRLSKEPRGSRIQRNGVVLHPAGPGSVSSLRTAEQEAGPCESPPHDAFHGAFTGAWKRGRRWEGTRPLPCGGPQTLDSQS